MKPGVGQVETGGFGGVYAPPKPPVIFVWRDYTVKNVIDAITLSTQIQIPDLSHSIIPAGCPHAKH
jgi:hypothetical protein